MEELIDKSTLEEETVENETNDNTTIDNEMVKESEKNDEQKSDNPPQPQNEIQRFYEQFRGVPLKYIDLFIYVCMTGLIAVVVIGILKAKGIM